MPEWTPIQAKMLQVLKDGRPHTKEELHACLNDDLSPVTNVYMYITAINKKLRVSEQEIICDRREPGKSQYRWVRLLTYRE